MKCGLCGKKCRPITDLATGIKEYHCTNCGANNGSK